MGLLKNSSSQTKVLAGGQSLIPALKTRTSPLIADVKTVVDISGIKELSYIRKGDELLKIGALTTVSTLENDLETASIPPILRDAASEIADPLVRNLGTVGGNLCYGDPVNDLPAAMISLNASAVLASADGENRKVNVENLYVSPYRTSVQPNEILTEVQIPLETAKCGSAYRKLRKGSGGFTIAGAAANLTVEDGSVVSACRLALTGVAQKVFRPLKAEQALAGKKFGKPVLDEAGKLAVEASQPVSDLYASEAYRRRVLGLIVKDALEAAYKRAVMGGNEES